MRVLFAGSPEIALPSLELLAAQHTVVGVLTNPAAPKGRGLCHACTPVADAAGQLLPGVPVFSPEKLGPQLRLEVAGLRPELLVVFAYGRIFGPKFLSLFPSGAINVHPSLLPRWRGCSPIPHAILYRDAETGVSVQRVALRMDTGAILAQHRFMLDGRETTGSLSEKAARIGAELLGQVIAELAEGKASETAQDEEGASYCRPFSKEDACLDWSLSALALDAHVRAFNPWPLAWTTLAGQRLTIHAAVPLPDGAEASEVCRQPETVPPGTVLCVDKSKGIMVQTGDGVLALTSLQLPGKRALPYREFANGVRDLPGKVLGVSS